MFWYRLLHHSLCCWYFCPQTALFELCLITLIVTASCCSVPAWTACGCVTALIQANSIRTLPWLGCTHTDRWEHIWKIVIRMHVNTCWPVESWLKHQQFSPKMKYDTVTKTHVHSRWSLRVLEGWSAARSHCTEEEYVSARGKAPKQESTQGWMMS